MCNQADLQPQSSSLRINLLNGSYSYSLQLLTTALLKSTALTVELNLAFNGPAIPQ